MAVTKSQKKANKKYYDKDPRKRLEATKNWRKKNPGYHARWHAANKVKNPTLYMWRNARNRAKIIGVEFTIVQADIVVPDVCPVLGIKLEFFAGKKKSLSAAPNAPSIDRFDNKKGYTAANIRVISNRANMLKRDATVEEVRLVLAYMERG